MKNENAKHTPGPWRMRDTWIEETVNIKGGGTQVEDILGVEIGAGPGEVVARLYPKAINYGEARTKYNARLIAAAPELLAALEKVLDGCLTAHIVQNGEPADEYIDLIRAAIAKAKRE